MVWAIPESEQVRGETSARRAEDHPFDLAGGNRMMPTFDDPPTPDEEEAAAMLAEFDQREADNIELLGELDAIRAELAAARAELDLMRASRDALARYIELIPDPMHQPSRPRDRARFAGEDHDDYALRGE